MKWVCVGGSLDGKLRAAPAGIACPRMYLPPAAEFGTPETYVLDCLQFGDGQAIRFWRLEALHPFDALWRVFTQYQRG